MSANALPTPPSPSGSLLYKLRYTPLRDALRGRLTATLDLVRVKAESELPAPLAAVVLRTVRRTRLWRSERLDVANELIAHFRDGLSSGSTAESLSSSFGNLDTVAKLIRRAKKRQRSLIWRSLARTMQMFGIALAVSVAAYLGMVGYLYSGSVHVNRNYAAEFNARVDAIPEDQRAWPIYRLAYLAVGPWPEGVVGREHPGSPEWERFLAFARDHTEAIELFKKGSTLPHLGSLLFDEKDAQLGRAMLARQPERWNPPVRPLPEGMPNNRVLCTARFYDLDCLRQGTRLLRIEALAAVDSGDMQTVVADVHAILDIAGHIGERPAIINSLTAASTLGIAADVIAYVLTRQPTLLSSDDLVKVSRHMATTLGGGTLPLKNEFELRSFDDMIQRVFTDDGGGDGHIAPPSIQYLGMFGAADKLGNGEKLALPLVASLHLGRRESVDLFYEMMARTMQASTQPTSRRAAEAFWNEIDTYRKGNWNALRFGFVSPLLWSSFGAKTLLERSARTRDLGIIAIALELYRRDRGRYPDRLFQLSPQYLDSIPTDPFDGNPIKYALIDGKPVLYSVGADRKDDGGRLPAGPDRAAANKSASVWSPADEVESGLRDKTIGDGDWILWPPIDN